MADPGPLSAALIARKMVAQMITSSQLIQEMTELQLKIEQPANLAGPFIDKQGQVTFKQIPENFEYWLTEDGRYMAVKDMESSHILRCIGTIFNSNRGWRAAYLPHLQAELDRREKEDGRRI